MLKLSLPISFFFFCHLKNTSDILFIFIWIQYFWQIVLIDERHQYINIVTKFTNYTTSQDERICIWTPVILSPNGNCFFCLKFCCKFVKVKFVWKFLKFWFLFSVGLKSNMSLSGIIFLGLAFVEEGTWDVFKYGSKVSLFLK